MKTKTGSGTSARSKKKKAKKKANRQLLDLRTVPKVMEGGSMHSRWGAAAARRGAACALAAWAAFFLFAAGARGAGDPLDSSFGDGGISVVSPPTSAGALGLTRDADGRLVVAGTNPFDNFIVARYLSDGRLDPAFGNQPRGGPGYVAADSGFGIRARAVGLQPGGEIVVAGGGFLGHLVVVRFLADGTQDKGFGKRGEARVSAGGDGAVAHDLSVAPDGKILVGGYGFDRSAPARGIIARLLANGRPDRSFGVAGVVRFGGHGAPDTEVAAVEVLPGGKVLWAGDSGGRIVIGRLQADGTPDRGFGGGDGRVGVDVGAGLPCGCGVASGLARDRQGRIVVSADLTGRGQRAVALLRVRASGKVDRGFGQGGIVRTTVGRRLVGEDVAVAPSGRITLVGASLATSGKVAATVVRFLPSGRRDPGFAAGGAFVYKGGFESFAYAALAQSDGRIVVAGRSNSGPSPFPENPSAFDTASFLLLRFDR
jgi:uncharacterized delta-60 repeat protein